MCHETLYQRQLSSLWPHTLVGLGGGSIGRASFVVKIEIWKTFVVLLWRKIQLQEWWIYFGLKLAYGESSNGSSFVIIETISSVASTSR